MDVSLGQRVCENYFASLTTWKNTHESSIVRSNRPENDKPEHSHAGSVFARGVFTRPRHKAEVDRAPCERLLLEQSGHFRRTLVGRGIVALDDASGAVGDRWVKTGLPATGGPDRVDAGDGSLAASGRNRKRPTITRCRASDYVSLNRSTFRASLFNTHPPTRLRT